VALACLFWKKRKEARKRGKGAASRKVSSRYYWGILRGRRLGGSKEMGQPSSAAKRKIKRIPTPEPREQKEKKVRK